MFSIHLVRWFSHWNLSISGGLHGQLCLSPWHLAKQIQTSDDARLAGIHPDEIQAGLRRISIRIGWNPQSFICPNLLGSFYWINPFYFRVGFFLHYKPLDSQRMEGCAQVFHGRPKMVFYNFGPPGFPCDCSKRDDFDEKSFGVMWPSDIGLVFGGVRGQC